MPINRPWRSQLNEHKGSRKNKRTLHKTCQHLAPRLQQRVSNHDLQKPLQSFPPVLNHVVAEPVREHLSGQRGDGDACALPLQDVAEVLEVGVAPAHDGMLELEGGDVGAADDLVRGVHVARGAVGLGVADLYSNGKMNLVSAWRRHWLDR